MSVRTEIKIETWLPDFDTSPLTNAELDSLETELEDAVRAVLEAHKLKYEDLEATIDIRYRGVE